MYGIDWNKNSKDMIKKYYSEIQDKENIKYYLESILSKNIVSLFLNKFPMHIFDSIYKKTNSNISHKKPTTFYFSFILPLTVKYIIEQIEPILYKINTDYKTNSYMNWYDYNKYNLVNWITLGIDKNYEIEMNMYIIDGKNIFNQPKKLKF